MNYRKWLEKNTSSLVGKRVAVTGATGGLGRELCLFSAELGADVLLIGRSRPKLEALQAEIANRYPSAQTQLILCDFQSVDSVVEASERIKQIPVDYLIHNAGVYHVPRQKTKEGFEPVFQVNFLAPYLMTQALLPQLQEWKTKVISVGSIASKMARFRAEDVDYSTCRSAMKAYGNSKRWMYLAIEQLCKQNGIPFAIAHPGISATNIISGYPKFIRAIVKYPMKWLFLSAKKGSLPIVRAMFASLSEGEWIGPRIFGVWGLPKVSKYGGRNERETQDLFLAARKIQEEIQRTRS